MHFDAVGSEEVGIFSWKWMIARPYFNLHSHCTMLVVACEQGKQNSVNSFSQFNQFCKLSIGFPNLHRLLVWKLSVPNLICSLSCCTWCTVRIPPHSTIQMRRRNFRMDRSMLRNETLIKSLSTSPVQSPFPVCSLSSEHIPYRYNISGPVNKDITGPPGVT